MNQPAPYQMLPFLREAWSLQTPMSRLQEIRRQVPRLRDAILASGTTKKIDTFDLITVPYPTEMGFSGAASSPAPYVLFVNRCNFVEFTDLQGNPKRLLFNPTDFEAARKTPFFARLAEKYGSFLSNKVMSKIHGTVAQHLQKTAIDPASIDYVAYDHLHTQDLRAVLGTMTSSGLLPNAKLLIQRTEWEISKQLHPLQRDWFIDGGTEGIDPARVVLLEGDYLLGKGIALISTPGHTYGNHSLCVSTASDTLYTISENGIAADAYAPEASRIPGLRKAAKAAGLEVILNGNTREATLDQYSSMVLEKLLAGPSKKDPSFCNHIPSSELVSSPLAPLLSPTFFHGPLRHNV